MKKTILTVAAVMMVAGPVFAGKTEIIQRYSFSKKETHT